MAFSMRTTLAISASHVLTFLMRLLGSGGTSLPGKIALKICPDLLSRLSERFTIVMVTGTNGKTTTSRMIAHLLDAAGLPHQTNKSGANLASGITATVAGACNLRGEPQTGWLLLEVDEAAFRLTAPALKPKAVVVTNFFRDQLDRYGELYSTLNSVRDGLNGSPGSILVYNADDSLCASLGLELSTGEPLARPLFPYGLSAQASPGKEPEVSDAAFCIRCSTRYTYTASSYGHLGHFHCSSCGYERPQPVLTCETAEQGPGGTHVHFAGKERDYDAHIGLPGLYNVYNGLSAAALAEALNLPQEAVIQALSSFERGFGRMESFEVDGRTIQIILVKNPTGFNQVLQYLTTLPGVVIPAFLINDRLADGTDVSWLWDVDFEQFALQSIDMPLMAVSGVRADDMAVRLKYAGVEERRIVLLQDSGELFDRILSELPTGGTICLMPTYTALLDLRKLLARRYKLKDFWK